MKYLILLLPLLFFACGQENVEFVKANVDSKFTVELPNYMEQMDLGTPNASLQFGSEAEEHYITIFEETNEQLTAHDVALDIRKYADYYMDNLKMGLANPDVEPLHIGIKQVNEMEAIGYKVRGEVPADNLKLASYVMFYRSQTTFYYVYTWTLANREAELGEYMKQIVYSLKEL